MIHITLPQLCAYLDGELAEASAELVRRHLSACLECAERFGRMEELDETLLQILSDEPEEEFFAHLSASIPLGQPVKTARPTKPAASTPAPIVKQKAKPVKQELKTKAKPPVKSEVKAEAKAEAKTEMKAEPKVVVKPGVKTEKPDVKAAQPSARAATPAPSPAPMRRKQRPEPRPRRRAEDYDPVISPRATAIAALIFCVVAGSIAWVTLRPKVRSQDSVTNAATTRDPAPTPEDLLDRSAEPTTEDAVPATTEGATPATTLSETTTPDEPSPPETLPLETTPQAPTPMPSTHQTKPKAKTAPPVAEKLVERAPQNFVPVRKIITETIVGPSAGTRAPRLPETPATPARVAPTPDASAAAVRDAKSASLDAATSKLPTAFDKSADAWERALPLLEDAPEALASARREWAQARFQAWAADPTRARRDAAVASSRQYLLYAPPGPERDQAWTWLGRLKH